MLERTLLVMVCLSMIACEAESGTEIPVLDASPDATELVDGGTPGVDRARDPADAQAIDAQIAMIAADAKPPSPAPETTPMVPLKSYGEKCSTNSQCESGVCLPDEGCTRQCDVELPNPCRAEKAFCVPVENVEFACAGMIDTGNDTDDAYVGFGDLVTRHLSTLKDADMFTVVLRRLEPLLLVVIPKGGIDVSLELYNAAGEPVGIFNRSGIGGVEGADVSSETDRQIFYAVVRNVGHTTGSYQFGVERYR